MSPSFGLDAAATVGFPRVSGDEPIARKTITTDTEFSPRERG